MQSIAVQSVLNRSLILLACLLAFGPARAAGGQPHSGAQVKAYVKQRATTYIALPPAPVQPDAGDPGFRRHGTASVVVQHPALADEFPIKPGFPTYRWELVSPAPGQLPTACDILLADADRADCDVVVTLTAPLHLALQLKCTVRWEFADDAAPAVEASSELRATTQLAVTSVADVGTEPDMLHFFALRAQLTAMPKAIAAMAQQAVPVYFQIEGAQRVEIQSVTFDMTRIDGYGTEFNNVWHTCADADGLLAGDRATKEPVAGETYAQWRNGETNHYTLLVPSWRFRHMDFTTYASPIGARHKSSWERGSLVNICVDILDLVAPGDGPEVREGKMVRAPAGPSLATARVRLQYVFDRHVDVYCLGVFDYPMDPFDADQSRSHRVATPMIRNVSHSDTNKHGRYVTMVDGSKTYVSEPTSHNGAWGLPQRMHGGVQALGVTYSSESGYQLYNYADTAWYPDSGAGDDWLQGLVGHEVGVFCPIWYGAKLVTDPRGRQWEVMDLRQTSGVNVTCWLFQDSTVRLLVDEIGDKSGGISSTLNITAGGLGVAAAVCALAPAGGWAAMAAGPLGVAAAAATVIAVCIVVEPDSYENARAEIWGMAAIMNADGDRLGQIASGASAITGPGTNTLCVTSEAASASVFSGEVVVTGSAAVHTTWKVYSAASCFARVKEGNLGNYDARARVIWTPESAEEWQCRWRSVPTHGDSGDQWVGEGRAP